MSEQKLMDVYANQTAAIERLEQQRDELLVLNAQLIEAALNLLCMVPQNTLQEFRHEVAILHDAIAKAEQEVIRLQATANRFAEIMAEKDRQLIAVARQRGELLAAAIQVSQTAPFGHEHVAALRKLDEAIAKVRG